VRVDRVTRATSSVLIKIYETLIGRDASAIFNDLLDKAAIYEKLIRPSDKNNLSRGFQELDYINAVSSYILLMYLMSLPKDSFENTQSLVGIVDFLQKYYVRRNITDTPSTRIIDQLQIDVIEHCEVDTDGLFKELQIALGYVGWRVLPENKDNLDSLRRGLHDVISSVGQMHRFNFDVIQSDEATFQFQFRVLEEAITQANELAKEQQEATLNAAEKMREIQLSSNLVAAIDALLPYAQADFQTTYNQLQTSKQSVNAGNSHFVGVRTPTQDDFFQPMLQQTVESVSEQITRRLSELRNSLQEAQQALKKIEATKAGLELLRTRLLSAAKELLEHVPNPDHCPVCHSDFEQGQLLARMVESNTEFSSDELGSIQTEISDVETEFDSISSVDASLKALIDFVGPSAKSLTVAEALLRIEESRAALEQEKSQLSITQNRLVGLESNGLTMTDLLAKLATANFTTLKSEEDLQQVKSTELALQANNRDRLHVIQAQLNKVRQETAVLANIYSLDVFISPQELVLQIRTIHQKLQSTFEAREIMRKYLTVGSVSSLDTLSATLKSMQELINKVQTISAKEVYENKALAQEAALIEQLTNEAKACEVKDRHLNEARILLEQLRQMGSGGALTMRILGENADEIGKTFAKIHMPNEFDIKSEEGELRIIRRQANENVDLVQMSTGQRAAFALSLFLAMNARLQSGPPILLFDDPVAHVDDINVLSFLDHLRDIAINGSRQIFFATADSKLAGLFRHKFRFLGSEDFREVNLVRDN
jgi:exonuclease SbcC